MFLVDSHCHFNMLDLAADHDDLNLVISRAQKNNVQYFLNVCVKMSEFSNLLAIAERYPCVDVSVGLHPNENSEEVDAATLIKLGQHKKVIAIGETGLDYFRTEAGVEWQKARFRAHMDAAKALRKPIIVHTRAAKDDTIRLMQEEKASEVGGVMHCFTEDLAMAKKALDMNFYISFSGIVTFKNSKVLQEVAKQIPLDRMLIETDAPYLAPDPHRGKQNEPAYVRYTAEYLANLHQVSLDEFAEKTTGNFFDLFKGAVNPHV